MSDTNSKPRFESSFKIIGLTEDSFIESYVAEIEEINSKLRTVNADFFLIIEVLNNEFATDEVADAIVETFRKHFYEAKDLDSYTRFEEALKFVNDVARDIQSNGLPLYQINVAIAALIQGNIYLSQANDAEIYLLRSGVVKNIAEGLSVGKRKEHSDLFENIATGNLDKNDVILFSTARLMRYIPQSDLSRFFYSKNVDSGLENIDDAIRTEVLGRIGVLAVKFNEFPNYNSVGEMQTDDLSDTDEKSSIFTSLKAKKGIYLKLRKNVPKYLKFAHESYLEFSEFLFNFFTGKRFKLDTYKHKYAVIATSALLFFIFLLFILYSAGVFISPSAKENKELLNQAAQIISNARSESNKQRAANLILSAESKVLDASKSKSLKTEVAKLTSEINDIKSMIDNLIVLKDLQLVADISVKRFDVSIQGLLKLGNAYYVHDGKRLYEFINDFVKDPATIMEQGKVIAASSFTESDSLIFYSDDNKIKEYASGVNKYMDTEDGIYKPASKLMAYGTRIYLLDTTAGNIWKYQRKRDSYGKAESALNNVDNEKIKKVVSMTVDGSVYLLYPNGDIEKYYAGSIESGFSVEVKPLIAAKIPAEIYTEVDFPYLMMADYKNKKIFQYYKDPKSKNLQYDRQYAFESLDELTGFAIDYASKRLYVTDKSKVYLTTFLN